MEMKDRIEVAGPTTVPLANCDTKSGKAMLYRKRKLRTVAPACRSCEITLPTSLICTVLPNVRDESLSNDGERLTGAAPGNWLKTASPTVCLPTNATTPLLLIDGPVPNPVKSLPLCATMS